MISLAWSFWPRYEVTSIRGGAVIIDSFYSPRPQFTDAAVALLTSHGIPVDAYKDAEVTVELYRRLPTYGYNLIILRVHSGVLQGDASAPIFLFTNEQYETGKYVLEQLERQVLSGKIDADNESEEPVFTVGPRFVAMSMEDNFNNSTVILSGCFGLYTDQLARAFGQKGARVFISWNERVTLAHTDEACMELLKDLINERITLNEAVNRVTTEVGKDKAYNSTLLYWPKEAGCLILKP
jgi:hypothetical protein